MVDVAEVKIWGEMAGAVRWDEEQQLGYFQYDPKFIQKGWDLSPIKMSIKDGSLIHSFPELRRGRGETEDTFKGLPGLLSDALPDKYGNQLINIWLAQQGRPENSMNPVEKLCFSFDETNHWVSKQTLSVNGKRLAIDKADLMTIAKDNNIKKGKKIIEEVNAVINSWNSYAKQAGVRSDIKNRIKGNLNTL